MVMVCEAQAAERVPIAVVWMGDAASADEGARIASEVDAALARSTRSPTARPLDSAADRKALVEGGPATLAEQHIARADAAFAKLKFSDAAREYALAERILFDETPVGVAQQRLGAVERGLLVCYDQLNQPDDAARAADRLGFTAGTNDDVQRVLDRYRRDHRWEPLLPPVQVTTVPPGATVYRDLQAVGAAPIVVPGGDPSIDTLDVELVGYRRAHLPLGSALSGAGAVEVKLEREDRVALLVDDLRQQAPEPPAGQVAALGQRVGAARVLILVPEGAAKVHGRWVDVRTGGWGADTVEVDAAGPQAMDRLAEYVAPAVPVPAGAVMASKQKPKPAEAPKSAWGKWYTWVAAGGVVILIGTLLIVDKVGSDKLTVTSKH